jgi:hypothetical protein
MSLVYPELTGDLNVTISPEKDEYVIIATGARTYTLPTIMSNGSRYVFTRVDSTSNIVTLRVDPSSTNTISSQAGIFTSNVLIGNKTLSEVISYNGVWYLFFTNSLSTISTPSFNASFFDNAGVARITGPVVVWVPFLGTGNGDFVSDFFLLAEVSPFGMNWSINSFPGGPTTSPPVASVFTTIYSSTVSQVEFQPVTANPLYVLFQSNNGSFLVYSFALY